MSTSPSPGPAPSADKTRRLLAERYGEPSPGRRRLVVGVVATLAVVGLAWLVWAGWAASDPEIDGDVVGFDVVSPHAVDVELVVDRDGGRTVSCTVRAQAEDGAVVGELVITIPAGDPGVQRVEDTVTTEREATTVQLARCD